MKKENFREKGLLQLKKCVDGLRYVQKTEVFMANFKAHTIWGGLWGVVCSIGAFFLGFASPVNLAVTMFLSVLGSAVPDLDFDDGHPRRLVLSFLSILIPLLVVQRFQQDLTAEQFLALGLAAFVAIRYLLAVILNVTTVHRGAFHSIPAGLITGELAWLLFVDSPLMNRALYTAAVFGAVVSHLILDEICAIRPMHLSVKKSFGNALKWSVESKIHTVLLYLLVLALGYFCCIV